MSVSCEICNKRFSRTWELNKHFQRNIKCSDQKKLKEVQEELEESQYEITRLHVKYQIEIIQLKEQLKATEDKLKASEEKLKALEDRVRILENPSREIELVFVNSVNVVMDLNKALKRFKDALKKMKYQDFLQGEKFTPYLRMLVFCFNPPNTNEVMYLCTDRSRSIFTYKTESGDVKEPDAKQLFNLELKCKPHAIKFLKKSMSKIKEDDKDYGRIQDRLVNIRFINNPNCADTKREFIKHASRDPGL